MNALETHGTAVTKGCTGQSVSVLGGPLRSGSGAKNSSAQRPYRQPERGRWAVLGGGRGTTLGLHKGRQLVSAET